MGPQAREISSASFKRKEVEQAFLRISRQLCVLWGPAMETPLGPHPFHVSIPIHLKFRWISFPIWNYQHYFILVLKLDFFTWDTLSHLLFLAKERLLNGGPSFSSSTQHSPLCLPTSPWSHSWTNVISRCLRASYKHLLWVCWSYFSTTHWLTVFSVSLMAPNR